MQKLVILRGAPSSGKSTIARSYRSFKDKVVWLKVDNFKDFFASDEALWYVNGSAVVTLKYLLEEGFSVVMEGVFQDTTALDSALEIAKELKIPARVFEMEVSLETLKKRDVIREGVPERKRLALGDETIEKLFNKLKNTPYPGAIKLDSESNSMEECKTLIEDSFN